MLQVLMSAGWQGQEGALVIARTVPNGRYQSITLEPTGDMRDPFLGAHRMPGQYLELRASDDETGYFAIANRPASGSSAFELLVRDEPGIARWLARAPVGTTIAASPPAGAGYPLSAMKGLDLLLLAAGSGIAPIHSLLDCIRAERQAYGWVRLYYGERRPADFAYRSWLGGLATDDIEVCLALSREGAGSDYASGYVQRIADEARNREAPSRLGIVVCGMEAMESETTERFTGCGVLRQRIFRNI